MWDAGPFTAAQAWEAGFTRSDIRRLVRRGEWVAVRRGVFVTAAALASVSEDRERRHVLEVAALLRALEFDAVAAGPSAALVWGLDVLVRPRVLTVVTDDPDAVGRRGRDYRLRTTRRLTGHRATQHGVPVTTVARTVVDVARTSAFSEGVVVADSALRRRLGTPGELAAVLAECGRWPGIERARRVVGFADPRSESVLESLSRVAMHLEGIPRPRTQVRIGDARVDFLWDDVGVVGEADGLGKYEPDGVRTTREIVRAEKRREERLADAGFEVVRWGWEDARNPPQLSRRLRAAFARGAERRRGRTAA